MEVVLKGNNEYSTKNKIVCKCPTCKAVLLIDSREASNLYRYGYKPIFCSRKCERDYST